MLSYSRSTGPATRLWGLALLGALAAPAAPAVATAAPRLAQAEAVSCTIRSMHGLNEPGGIDQRLSFLRAQLTKPPFSSYKTIRLLEAKTMAVAQEGTAQVKLPTGKLLRLSYKEKLLERKGKVRLRLHLSITPPQKTKFLPGTVYTIADGGTLLVAGDRHLGGTLVVGITCQQK